MHVFDSCEINYFRNNKLFLQINFLFINIYTGCLVMSDKTNTDV